MSLIHYGDPVSIDVIFSSTYNTETASTHCTQRKAYTFLNELEFVAPLFVKFHIMFLVF